MNHVRALPARQRFPLRLLAFLFFVLAVGTGAIELQKFMVKRAQLVQNQLIALIEGNLGFNIRYKSIAPNFINRIQMIGLQIDGERIKVEVDRVMIVLDWRSFLSGGDPADMIRRIEVDGVHVVMGQSHTTSSATLQETVDALSLELFTFLQQGFDLPFLGVKVFLRQVNIDYRSAWGGVRVSNGQLTIIPQAEHYAVQLDGAPEFTVGEIVTVLPVSLAGTLSPQLNRGDITLSVRSFIQEFLSLPNQTIRMVWADGQLELRNTLASRSLDYIVRINASEQLLYAEFSTLSLQLSEILARPEDRRRVMKVEELNGRGSVLYYPSQDVLYYGLVGNIQLAGEERSTQVQIDLSGDKWTIFVSLLRLKSGGLQAGFNGTVDLQTYFPSGRLLIAGEHQNQRAAVVLNFKAEGSVLQITEGRLDMNGDPVAAVVGQILSMEDSYSLWLALATISENPEVIELVGFYNPTSGIGRVSSQTDRFSSRVLSNAGLFPTAFSDWWWRWNLRVDIASEQFFVTGSELALIRGIDDGVRLSFTADRQQLRVQNMSVRWGDVYTQLWLESSMTSEPEFNGQIRGLKEAYSFDGKWGGGLLTINNASGQVLVDFKQKKAQVAVVDLPIGFGVHPPQLSVRLQAQWQEAWSVQLAQLELRDNTRQFSTSNAFFNERSGTVQRFTYTDEISTVSGGINYGKTARGYMLSGVAESDGAPISREIYGLDLFYDYDDITGSVDVRRFPLVRLGVETLEGDLNLDMRIASLLKHPDLIANVNVSRGFFNDFMMRFDGQVRYTEEGLQLGQMEGQYGEHLMRGGMLLANVKAGSLSFSSRYARVNRQVATGISFVAQSTLPSETEGRKPSWMTMLTSDFSAQIGLEPLMVSNLKVLGAMRLRLQKYGDQFTLLGLDGLDLQGDFNMLERVGAWRWFDVNGLQTSGRLNMNPDVFSVDIDHLRVPLEIFNPILLLLSDKRIVGFESGFIQGFLSIGPGSHIERGQMVFNNAAMRVSYFPQDTLRLDGMTLFFEDNLARLGPYDIPAGRFSNRMILRLQATAEFSLPRVSYVVDLNMLPKDKNNSDNRGVVYEFNLGNDVVRFRGTMQGWIRLSGENKQMRVSGDLTVPQTQGNLGAVPVLFGGSNTIKRRIPTTRAIRPVLNVSISPPGEGLDEPFIFRTGRAVTFFIPDSSVPTIQVTMSPEQNLYLVMDITPSDTSGNNFVYVVGDLTLASGEINYFSNPFKIREGGLIRFNEELGFNPLLIFTADLRTTSRVRGGPTHTITMEFASQALDRSFDFPFSSPTLNQNEIMVELGAIIRPSTEDLADQENIDALLPQEDDPNAAIKSVVKPIGDVAGQYLSRQLEQIVRFIPFIDTIEVRTSAVSNLLLDRLESDPFATNTQNTSAWDLLDGTSINAGFAITRNFFIEFSFGVVLEQDTQLNWMSGSNERLVTQIGLSLQFDTPWFLINWGFYPTFTQDSWNQLLVPAVSLSFTRTISFGSWSDLWK